MTLLRTTKAYLRRWGRPLAFYVDKDSIYRVNRQATIEEPLQDSAPLTQFTRAMRALGIAVIPAHSPQAKGRVERSVDTHQDRLVKELRLAGIATVAEANHVLHNRYLPRHNARFAVEPANATNAHRPPLPRHDLDTILSLQTPRTVERDCTVRWQNRFFPLGPEQPVRVRPGDTVLIEQRLDGTTHLRAKGRYLAFQPIAKPAPRPSRVATRASRVRRAPGPPRPPSPHPWKDPSYFAMLRRKGRTNGRCAQVHTLSTLPPDPHPDDYDYRTMTFLFGRTYDISIWLRHGTVPSCQSPTIWYNQYLYPSSKRNPALRVSTARVNLYFQVATRLNMLQDGLFVVVFHAPRRAS